MPTLHLALCILVQLNPSEGSWTWFPFLFVDFPYSLLALLLGHIVPSGFVVFGLFGTLWWYFVGVVARWILLNGY